MATVNLFLDKLYMKEVYYGGFCRLTIHFASKQCKISYYGKHEGYQAFEISKATLATSPLFMRSSHYHVMFRQQFILTDVVFPLQFSVKFDFGRTASESSTSCRFRNSFTSNHVIERAEYEVRAFRVPLCELNYSVLGFTMGCLQDAVSFRARTALLLHDSARREMLLKDRLTEQACFARFISDGAAQAVVECRAKDGKILPTTAAYSDARTDWVHEHFEAEDFRVRSVTSYFVSFDEWCARSGLCERLKTASAIYKRNISQIDRKRRTTGYHMLFFVHGYMGSWCDFRDFKNRLALHHLQDEHFMFVLCYSFYYRAKPELNLFSMGHFLALEVLQKVSECCGRSFEQLCTISFVGFSMGNIVVQACAASQAFAPLRKFLFKCFCINGPFLGMRPPALTVALGVSCVRYCSGNVCLAYVENSYIDVLAAIQTWAELLPPCSTEDTTVPGAEAQAASLAYSDDCFEFLTAETNITDYKARYEKYPRQSYNTSSKTPPPAASYGNSAFSSYQRDHPTSDSGAAMGTNMRLATASFFMGIGGTRLSRLGTLDFMALFSHAALFEQVVLFGSRSDGYVAEDSAICAESRNDKCLNSWFIGCRDVRRYSILNPASKRRKGGCINVMTGRNVHLIPLIDQQAMGTLCCIVGECFAELLGNE